MKYENIIYDENDGIVTLTLNRPKAFNALCRAINNDLEAALKVISENEKIRVLILTGGEKVFAAGADIKEMQNASPMAAEKTAAQAQAINNTLESLPIPVIAAVSGMAFGGGFELVLSCDFRVIAENAAFALPEVGLGILPGAGGTQRLARMIGAGRSKEIVMLGRKMTGKEAGDIGLATMVVPADQVMTEAVKMANVLKEKPAAALYLAKSAINCGENYGYNAGKLFEKLFFSLTFSTPDQKEGMTAFQEKRPPSYTHQR